VPLALWVSWTVHPFDFVPLCVENVESQWDEYVEWVGCDEMDECVEWAK